MARLLPPRKTKSAPPFVVENPDWPAVIRSLQRAGYTKAEIGRSVGLSKDLMIRILKGLSSPRWAEGQALLDMKNALGKKS